MDELEKLYNKRFKDKELPNDDFDVDGLWDAVEESLDAGDSNGLIYGSYILPFGILMLFFVGLGVYLYTGNTNEEAIAIATNQKNKTEVLEKESEKNSRKSYRSKESNTERGTSATANDLNAESEEDSNVEKQQKTTASTITEPTQQNTATLTSKVNGSEESNSRNNPTNDIGGNTASSSLSSKTSDQPGEAQRNRKGASDSSLAKTKAETPNEVSPKTTKTIEGITTEKTNVENRNEVAITSSTETKGAAVQEINTSSNEIQGNSGSTTAPNIALENEAKENKIAIAKAVKATQFSLVDLVSTQYLFSEKKYNSKGEIIKDLSIYPLISPNKERLFDLEVDVFTGVNKLSADFTTMADSNAISNVEQGAYGNSFGLKFGLRWKKNWSLKTGFEYHKLWSTFNYEATTSRQVEKENAIVLVVIDPNTDSTVNQVIVDSLMVTETTIRNIVHYNSYKLYSIPLEVGWQSNKNKLVYGLSAGLSFNFVRQQEGRRLDRENIVTNFTSDDDLAAFKSFGIGFRVTPMLGYRLTSRMTVKLLPEWERSVIGKSTSLNGNGGITKFGLNVGLAWRF